MGIIDVKICSNCRKTVPQHCDGLTYSVPDWTRLVCRGKDGDDFLTSTTGELRFKIVMGHGCSYDVPLTVVE